MTSTAVSSASVTSWWYGQARAVDVARRLESLYTLSPPPAGPAGLVTAHRDELTVTFVAALKSPLPHPWRAASNAHESRIPWEDVDPCLDPDPDHPVYLVVFGTTDDGGLVGLNLAALQRVRIDGDSAVTTALVSRWVLELLATHPDITVGVTVDVWRGPLTTRVQSVAVGHVPAVDVLVCGPNLSYTDRAQIVSSAASKIMIDLGADAAVDSKWTISCGPDRLGQISNGATRPMTATLLVPSATTVERCSDLLTAHPDATSVASEAPESTNAAERLDELFEADEANKADVSDNLPVVLPESSDTEVPEMTEGFDVFAHSPAAAAQPGDDDATAVSTFGEAARWPDTDCAETVATRAVAADRNSADLSSDDSPAEIAASPLIDHAAPSFVVADDRHYDTAEAPEAPGPETATIWNRILGQVDLCPPYNTQPGKREKRLNELTVFLQYNRVVDSSEIIRAVYGGAASDKTVTQQVSMLRARLGPVRPAGPKALPPMRDGSYILDSAVRSDWMEFERLVEIVIETTPSANLVAAMDLVTGPPFGGVASKEWEWTNDLRDEIRDRVGGAAVVLARRHYSAKKFGAAVEIARKGLWYDNVRQDLWYVGLHAAIDGHDKDASKALRSQYLRTVAGSDRDPAVFDLTKQAG